MRVTDEQVAAAKAKDARAKKVTLKVMGETIDVVIRPPTRAEWKSFKQLRANPDEAKSSAANEQLLTFCTIFPDPKGAEFSTLFDQYPGLSDTLWSYAAKMAGMSAEVEVGE